MRKAMFVICLVVAVFSVPAVGMADVDFVLEINPLSYLISPDVDDFTTSNGVIFEEISGVGSLYPTFKAGIGLESRTTIIDILAGVGYLWNDAFNATTISGDLFVRFKIGQRGIFTLGPHVGIISFNPDWDGTSEIVLQNETGWAGGLALTVGSSRVAFSAVFDYLSADIGVEPSSGWTANKSTLDISGLLIQLGVQFRF
jgi:hypothetical protein